MTRRSSRRDHRGRTTANSDGRSTPPAPSPALPHIPKPTGASRLARSASVCAGGRGKGLGGSSGCRRERSSCLDDRGGRAAVVVAHRLRVVRLLPLRHAGGFAALFFRRATRPRGCCRRDRELYSGLAGAAIRRARRSAASATSSAGSTPSWSPSRSWARPPWSSACSRPTRPSASRPRYCSSRLRLAQGLALGGEYGGAATYVAEHAPDARAAVPRAGSRRPPPSGSSCRSSSWRLPAGDEPRGVRAGGGDPFLLGRAAGDLGLHPAQMEESPVFRAMRSQGKASPAPLREVLRSPDNKYVAIALFGATAGQGVVWYTGQFYALFFLLITLKVDYVTTYVLVGVSLLVASPCFILFGALSDRIGRKPIILAGCLLAAVTYLRSSGTHALRQSGAGAVPAFHAGDRGGERLQRPRVRRAGHRVHRVRPGQGLPHQGGALVPVAARDRERGGDDKHGGTTVAGWDSTRYKAALEAAGYPAAAARRDRLPDGGAILVVMVIYVTMVYGPIAVLVELFPAKSGTRRCRCRITSGTAGSGACSRSSPPRGRRLGGHLPGAVVSDRGVGADACGGGPVPAGGGRAVKITSWTDDGRGGNTRHHEAITPARDAHAAARRVGTAGLLVAAQLRPSGRPRSSSSLASPGRQASQAARPRMRVSGRQRPVARGASPRPVRCGAHHLAPRPRVRDSPSLRSSC